MYTIKCKDPAGVDFDVYTFSPDMIDVYTSFVSNQRLVWDTVSDLQGYIENFDPRITVLCRTQQVARLQYAGFTNIINLDDYAVGDKWTFENGSYYEKVTAGNIELYYADGTNATGDGINFAFGIMETQIAWFVNMFPESVATEITSKYNEYGAGGELEGRTYNSIMAILASYNSSLMPPSFVTEGWNLVGGKDQIVPYPALRQTQHLDSLNRFYEGIEFTDDPYAENPDGDASEGGGDGDFDRDSDSIDHPALPTTDAVDTGFITIYNPSLSELQNLASYMWSGPFDLNSFKKIFADPMDAILGLSMVPCIIPNGGTQSVKVGNIDTGITMTKAAKQFVKIDCGSLYVKTACNNSYFDYGPFTKAYIYLPFIGTHAIDIDDIVKKNVSIKYNIDILSGGCVATIKCGNSVRYDFQGSCATEIPVTGQSFAQMYSGIINIGGQIGQMVASGGIAGGLGALEIASTAMNSLKPDIERSGAIGAVGGILGREKPALIIHNPNMANSSNQNKYLGYPSFITSKLGSLTGYTEIESVRLQGMTATDAEKDEIERLLKGGVIL